MLEYGRARPEEEADLVDFANYVFSFDGNPTDFVKLQPRVYGRPGFAALTQVAREGGKIKGQVAAITGKLRLGRDSLKFGYVGTVSTHPYARGKGIMRELMQRTMDSLREQGCAFLALGGQRQRYNYYGFEDAGSSLYLNLTRGTLRHALGKEEAGNYTFTPFDENNREALELAQTLHRAGAPAVERAADDFALILRTWDGKAWMVSKDGQPEGYLYYTFGCLMEAFLKTPENLPRVLAALLKHEGREDITVSLPAWELAKHPLLFKATDSWNLRPGLMIRVLDWQSFLESLLRFKATLAPLKQGRGVLEITGEGRFEINVNGSTVSVRPSDGQPDLALDSLAAIRLTCLPVGSGLYPNHPFLDWFPLPLSFPAADGF